jgi:heterotetrameric sarcosine oxidase gamma subunit
MAEHLLVPRSAFTTLAPIAAGPGVIVSDRDGLGLATVLVRKGRTDALAARVKERFNIDLPHGPQRAGHDGVAFAGTGPETWLVTGETGGNALAASLRDAIGEHAAVVDQSDGYAVLRITGPKVRETLAKGVPLDLHPRAFRVGDTAVTAISHIVAILWRLEDAEDGTPVFEVAVFRSLAGSFWDWLAESSAEFGVNVQAS